MLEHRVGRRVRAGALATVVTLGGLALTPARPIAQQAQTASAALPARLNDTDFWALENSISEPGGYFRITDNYTSNEAEVGRLMTALRDRKLNGGVYLGVGPEQNFSYIAAIQPAMAFIIDIRRQAVMQHLMFKTMFEMARDRADFISLLFAKPKPKDLDPAAPIQQLWPAFFNVATDATFAAKVRAQVIDRLTTTHKFALTPDERAQLEDVIAAFVQFGPGITTRGTFAGGRGGGGNNVTFADLTGWSYDDAGAPQSFLATDAQFQTVKALQDRNLIVPVSGDFGGSKALRAVAAYLNTHGGKVTAFYVSNVEQYLFQDGKAQAFYDNVATLPITSTSVFIRPYALRRYGGNALCGIAEFLKHAQAGQVYSNNEATACAW